MEAWKQKQAAEKNRKQKEIDAVGGTRKLLDEMDKKEKLLPAPGSPALLDEPADDISPTPYAGKFDPKAIAKKATANSAGVTKLGTDIALPEIAKASSRLPSSNTGLTANRAPEALSTSIGKRLHFYIFVIQAK